VLEYWSKGGFNTYRGSKTYDYFQSLTNLQFHGCDQNQLHAGDPLNDTTIQVQWIGSKFDANLGSYQALNVIVSEETHAAPA
jgi:hypothetical protein